jgi:hypothetical protein
MKMNEIAKQKLIKKMIKKKAIQIIKIKSNIKIKLNNMLRDTIKKKKIIIKIMRIKYDIKTKSN